MARLFGLLLLVIAAGLTVGVLPNVPRWGVAAACVGLALVAVAIATLARVPPAEGTESASPPPPRRRSRGWSRRSCWAGRCCSG